MASFKISDFKMFEETTYELPDPRAFTEVIMRGVKAQEKIYGPVFSSKVINYATRLIAKQRGEEPPEDIIDLDQLTEYVISKSEKMPPYWVVLWAQFVTEKKFEGHRGAGTRFMEMGISESVMERWSGEVEKLDIDNVLSKLRQVMVEMKLAPRRKGYKKNEDGSIDVLYRDCFLLDGCLLALGEGLLRRADGRMVCGFFGTICRFFKEATGSEWDYTIHVFDKPNCIARCFML
ncbi:MAG: hypothetical protein ACETWM_03900 [Candidatus Lokiarchaeia archaeon]